MEPEDVTLEQALELIAAKAGSKGKEGRAPPEDRPKAKTASAAKPAAKKAGEEGRAQAQGLGLGPPNPRPQDRVKIR
jgi:DNA topoisomerase I